MLVNDVPNLYALILILLSVCVCVGGRGSKFHSFSGNNAIDSDCDFFCTDVTEKY